MYYCSSMASGRKTLSWTTQNNMEHLALREKGKTGVEQLGFDKSEDGSFVWGPSMPTGIKMTGEVRQG